MLYPYFRRLSAGGGAQLLREHIDMELIDLIVRAMRSRPI